MSTVLDDKNEVYTLSCVLAPSLFFPLPGKWNRNTSTQLVSLDKLDLLPKLASLFPFPYFKLAGRATGNSCQLRFNALFSD